MYPPDRLGKRLSMKRIGEISQGCCLAPTTFTLSLKKISIPHGRFMWDFLEVDRTTAVRVRIDIGPEDRKKTDKITAIDSEIQNKNAVCSTERTRFNPGGVPIGRRRSLNGERLSGAGLSVNLSFHRVISLMSSASRFDRNKQ